MRHLLLLLGNLGLGSLPGPWSPTGSARRERTGPLRAAAAAARREEGWERRELHRSRRGRRAPVPRLPGFPARSHARPGSLRLLRGLRNDPGSSRARRRVPEREARAPGSARPRAWTEGAGGAGGAAGPGGRSAEPDKGSGVGAFALGSRARELSAEATGPPRRAPPAGGLLSRGRAPHTIPDLPARFSLAGLGVGENLSRCSGGNPRSKRGPLGLEPGSVASCQAPRNCEPRGPEWAPTAWAAIGVPPDGAAGRVALSVAGRQLRARGCCHYCWCSWTAWAAARQLRTPKCTSPR